MTNNSYLSASFIGRSVIIPVKDGSAV
jgi:hypothetical protein